MYRTVKSRKWSSQVCGHIARKGVAELRVTLYTSIEGGSAGRVLDRFRTRDNSALLLHVTFDGRILPSQEERKAVQDEMSGETSSGQALEKNTNGHEVALSRVRTSDTTVVDILTRYNTRWTY